MFIDLTTLITPKIVTDAQGNEKNLSRSFRNTF